MAVNPAFSHELDDKKTQAKSQETKKAATPDFEYKSIFKERQRAKQINDPAVMRRAYEEFWSTSEQDRDSIEDTSDFVKVQGHRQEFKSDYVAAFEDAYLANNGDIPDSFFYQFDIDDLRNFAHTVPHDVAQGMYLSQQREAELVAHNNWIEEEVERRLAEEEDEGGLLGKLGSLLTMGSYNFADVESTTASRRYAIRQRVIQELQSPPPEVDSNFWGNMNQAAPLLFGVAGAVGFTQGVTATDSVGWTFDKALTAAQPALTGLQWIDENIGGASVAVNPLGRILNYRESQLEEQRLEDLRAIQEMEGYRDVYAQQSLWEDSKLAWEEMTDDEKDLFIQTAGGDEIQAFGLFSAQYMDDPTADEQLQEYADRYDEEMRESIKQLEEQDFSSKDAMLDTLAFWGNFTADVAIGSLLLIKDDDIAAGDFEGLFDKIAEHDHSPASVMGWDGSALGIGFDFGMMALFDPLTYMFGGSAASNIGRGVSRTGKQALKALDSPATKSHISSVVKAARSPDTPAAAVVTMAGLDGIGAYQLFEVLDTVSPVFSRLDDKLWRRNYPNAAEMLVEDLAGLIPVHLDETVDAAKAAKAIEKRKGFNRPVTIEVSPNGAVRVAKGDMSALVAAVDNGWGAVPTQIKYIDNGLGAYNADEVAKMRAVHENLPEANTLSVMNREAQQVGTLDDWQQVVSRDDTVLGTFKRGDETYTVKVGEDPYAAGAEARINPDDPWAWAREAGAAQRLANAAYNRFHYVVNEAGEVVGGYNGHVLLRNMDDKYKGIMHDALRASEEGGDSFLPRLVERAGGESPDFSVGGRNFLKRALDDRLTIGDDAQHLSDVWGDAAKLPEQFAAGEAKPVSLLDSAGLKGQGALEEQVREVYKGQLMRNGRLENQSYTAVARGVQSMVRSLSKGSNFFKEVDRMMTQRNLSRSINVANGRAMDEAMDYLLRLWGDDADGLNMATQKLLDRQRGVGAARKVINKKNARLHEVENTALAIKEELGTLLERVDDATRDELKAMMPERAQLEKQLADLENEAGKIRADTIKLRSTMPDNSDIFKIIDESIDEYNRKYLATMDGWKPYLDENGLVPREILQRGIPDPKTKGAKGAGKTFVGFSDEIEEFKELNKTLKSISSTAPDNYDLGVSALDLAVARQKSGAAYMRWTQKRTGNALRETGHAVTAAWMIDKVMRPATAAVVTIDEVMRILHLYGSEAMLQYMRDKADFLAARSATAFRRRNPFEFFSKEAVQEGASALSPRAQERIRRLQDHSSKISASERTFFDQHGIGYTDIDLDDPLYRDYAQRWSSQFLNDSGFRAFLDGQESFAKWWDESPDAARLQDKAKVVQGGRKEPTNVRTPTMEEVYQGWETMWEVLTSNAKKAGKLNEFSDAWRATAAEVGATGKMVPLPQHVFDNFIPVRGAQKIGGGAVNRMTDKFFDRLFMDPVNYRRGFIAEMTRKTERKRLREFYASQGKQIVPDSMLRESMELAGFDPGMGTEQMARMWADSNFIPESYVTQTIERTVEKEIEHMLYVWNMGSRAGEKGRLVFPFGKPYADMMGFWGREMMKKPVLRGYFTNDNFLNMESAVNTLPVNPKTGALISRLAATDMEVDRGWVPEEGDRGEGLLPGSESSDLSPLFFLPTDGDDVLGTMLPGLGYIPLAFLDTVLNTVGPDPVTDPVEYNKWVDGIAFALPYFDYQQGGLASRLLGGGTIATGLSAAVDVSGWYGGKTYFNVTSELGDIGREIRRAREVSVLLSDPEELAELAKITDPEQLELYITGLVDEANEKASSSHLKETAGRWTVPARTKFDITGAELQGVWIESGQQFQDILGVKPQSSLETEEGRRQYANDIRSAFFNLDGWQRDVMVAANPSLAVNLVSSWDWTPKAVAEGFHDTDLPYSTGGKPEDLLRHDYFVKNGFVRPIQPAQRARLILGQIAEARDNSVKFMYESVASEVNGIIWEEDIAGTRAEAWLQEVQDEYGERFGTRDVQHLWQNWYTVEQLILEDLELQGEDFSEGGRSLGFPDDMKPWSTTWPGYERASKKFNSLSIDELPEDAAVVSELLGLPWNENMDGEQFHTMLAEELSQNEALVYGVTRPSWDQFTQERLAFSNSSRAQLAKAQYDPRNDAQWRQELIEWEVKVANLREAYRDFDQGVPSSVRQEIVQEFGDFVATSKDKGSIPWDTIWRGRYESSFGALDWTPPEPLSPLDEEGVKRGTTKVPIIHSIVDGDTLIFSENHDNKKYAVRLLGVDAPEYGNDTDRAEEATKRLRDFIQQAKENGDRIYLVTDPDRFLTHTDRYGRMLAWLWAGDEPFYFEEEMNPRFTPSGSDN